MHLTQFLLRRLNIVKRLCRILVNPLNQSLVIHHNCAKPLKLPRQVVKSLFNCLYSLTPLCVYWPLSKFQTLVCFILVGHLTLVVLRQDLLSQFGFDSPFI